MTKPGRLLREVSSRVFSPATMSRLIDPAITDLQIEYDEACPRPYPWRATWVRFCGYVAFANVVAQCGPFEIRHAMRSWNESDRHAVTQALWVSALVTLVVTILMVWLELSKIE